MAEQKTFVGSHYRKRHGRGRRPVLVKEHNRRLTYKILGNLYLDKEKWFITDVEYKSNVYKDYVKMTLKQFPSKYEGRKNIVTKTLIIYTDDALWQVVEALQRRYPHAVYWKTKKQRERRE